MTYDAIVVGGSYAGMAAALQLARARRSVLMLDEGLRRNRFAEHSHGFLTQDGAPPQEIAETAREQLMAYPTVEWRSERVEAAEATSDGFAVRAARTGAINARRLVLATGVTDTLPDIPGLKERWGKSVFHCPYCHGYELDGGSIAVLASSAMSMHHALMLPDWGPTTLLLNGGFVPDKEQTIKLEERGVTVVPGAIAEIAGERADVIMQDGRALSFDGMFTLTQTRPTSPLAEGLGCRLEDGPLGPFIQTDWMKATSVPGVFACGDAARAAGSVALAVGDGTQAGVAAHRSMIFGM